MYVFEIHIASHGQCRLPTTAATRAAREGLSLLAPSHPRTMPVDLFSVCTAYSQHSKSRIVVVSQFRAGQFRIQLAQADTNEKCTLQPVNTHRSRPIRCMVRASLSYTPLSVDANTRVYGCTYSRESCKLTLSRIAGLQLIKCSTGIVIMLL